MFAEQGHTEFAVEANPFQAKYEYDGVGNAGSDELLKKTSRVVQTIC